jgi:hypothetical protein
LYLFVFDVCYFRQWFKKIAFCNHGTCIYIYKLSPVSFGLENSLFCRLSCTL